MALADRLATPPADIRRGPRCGIGRILDDLPDPDRAALDAALEDRAHWQGTDIARALTAEGHHTTSQTVNRHRKGDCLCSST